MMWEQYLWSAVSAAIGSVLAWFLSRSRQKADIKKVEVEILEQALRTLNEKVVEPLQQRYDVLQQNYDNISKQFDDFKAAVSKRFSCVHLDSCPIMRELQRIERDSRTNVRERNVANRQRAPDYGTHRGTTPYPGDNDGYEIKDY